MLFFRKRIPSNNNSILITGNFLKRVTISKLFFFKVKNRYLDISDFKTKIKFFKNSLILVNSLFFLNLNFYYNNNKFFINYFLENFEKFTLLYSFVKFDIIDIINLLKIKLMLFLFLFKFNIKNKKFLYITNNFKNYNYIFYNKSLAKNSFVNYFCFLKKIKKVFISHKKYNVDCFIFKKKGSSLKRFDKVKNFLLFRTRKLLFLNKDNTFNNTFINSKNIKYLNKRAKISRKFKFNFIKFNFFKKLNRLDKKAYNNLTIDSFFKKFNSFFYKKEKTHNFGSQKTLFLKRGFFSILLENRKLIKTINFFKFKKQKTITKFLKKKVFVPTKNFYLSNEFLLVNILLRSQFFFFKTDIIFFLYNKYVFVNGFTVNSLNKILCVGDRIQLVVSDNYYYFFRTHKFFTKLFLQKIKKKVFRMFKPKNDMYKQKSNYTPN